MKQFRKVTRCWASIVVAFALVFATTNCAVFPQNLAPDVKAPSPTPSATPLSLQYSFFLGDSRIVSGMLMGDDDAVEAIRKKSAEFGFEIQRVAPQVDPVAESQRKGERIRVLKVRAVEDASSSAIAAIMIYVFLGLIPWKSSVRYEVQADTYENGTVVESYFVEDSDSIWAHLILLPFAITGPAVAQSTLDNIVANYFSQLRQREFAAQ
ncbi:MAG: hypothetical protein KDH09_17035 [Chrysiogenetes bacterium]|nr:hypothetical protein [Chrysiogenetes bacterium]